jgi:hypothetical protein
VRFVSRPSTTTAAHPPISGLVSIPIDEGARIVWSLASFAPAAPPADTARRLRRALRDPRDVAGVVLELSGIDAPTPSATGSLLDLAGEMERRGIGVVAVGGSADLLTALSMEDDLSRLPRVGELSAAISLLREFDDAARRLASHPGGPARVVRFPARRESVAPICRLLRLRLGEDGLAPRARDRIVRRAWDLIHTEILAACDASSDHLGVCARVHQARVTVTLLDEGAGSRPDVRAMQGPGGLCVHRFRILGKHHATILEAPARQST